VGTGGHKIKCLNGRPGRFARAAESGHAPVQNENLRVLKGSTLVIQRI
jgi:hypothetical protein